MRAILHCRTAALGGHIDICPRCGGDKTISYNSCRNRHCPKCQTQARQRWIDARKQELLQTRYFHVVFTLPHELQTLILQNQAALDNLLFRMVANTLLEVAANPEHLGGRHRLLRHPAHVGAKLAVPSSHSLCHPRWRTLTGPLALDSPAISVLSTDSSSPQSIPGK